MARTFRPRFTVTPAIVNALMRIEGVKESMTHLPITARVLARLRETARLFSTHYSTQIEGNRLTQAQVARVIEAGQHFPGREREEAEVKGYYAALDEVERLGKAKENITEAHVRKLHALVMAAGKSRVKPTPYRDGQNVIRDSRSRSIVYAPPEAKDVPKLMKALVAWLNNEKDWPVPIRAAVAHYQYATIHPYYDGNGRTARLLTTLVLHLGGYDLKGLYALEEYYARNLSDYYEALAVGPSHNYYEGREEADITQWPTLSTARRIPLIRCATRPWRKPRRVEKTRRVSARSRCQAKESHRPVRKLAGSDRQGDRRSVRLQGKVGGGALPAMGG